MFSFLRNCRDLSIVQSLTNLKKFLSTQNHDILGTRLTELGRSRDIKWFTEKLLRHSYGKKIHTIRTRQADIIKILAPIVN